jgi:uncharacterized protein
LLTSPNEAVPRFLCDEMLHGVGRWLRAAGYDTVIAVGGLSDCAVAACCTDEDRILLTKDRHLAATVTGGAPVLLLPEGGIDEAARALRIALDIDWQHAPFTRCIVDNWPLEAAPRLCHGNGRATRRGVRADQVSRCCDVRLTIAMPPRL